MSDVDDNGERQAVKSWSDVWVDLILVVTASFIPFVLFAVDLIRGGPEWFQRSGAAMVVFAGILGYWSLKRHWRKFINAFRRDPMRAYTTSQVQNILDKWTLGIAGSGTVIWGYGDWLIRALL